MHNIAEISLIHQFFIYFENLKCGKEIKRRHEQFSFPINSTIQLIHEELI